MLVFICYPETYVLLNEQLAEDRFSGEEQNRIVAIVSAWEAAIQQFGDGVMGVEVYSEPDGTLSFKPVATAWDGRVKIDE